MLAGPTIGPSGRRDTRRVEDQVGLLRTTIPVVPDAPIGHFQLTVFGGKSGYLVNTRSLCAHRPVIAVGYEGQNGRDYTQKVNPKTATDRIGQRSACSQ